jgi:hypothetical protein
MRVTRKTVASKLSGYLRHRLTVAQLVDWAERVMMDGQLAGPDAAVVRDAVASLGLADVREFGLSWEDCESMLQKLGYSVRVDVTAKQSA